MTSTIDPIASSRRTTPTPSLPSGDTLLRNGSRGPEVRSLQEALKARGHDIQVDGIYGDETERSVRAFQRSQSIGIDGIAGPQTIGKLSQQAPTTTDVRREGPARAPTMRDATPLPDGQIRAGDLARNDETRRRGAITLAPAGATPEEKFQHYSDIVRRNGGQVNPNGQATVLGLRGLDRNGGAAHDTTSARAYDDTFVVLQNGRAYEYAGATHAAQARSTLSPDVNRDGQGDVGMIKPGNYTARPNGPYNGNSSWHVTNNGNGRIPAYRDTSGDRVFSDAERAASDRRGDTQTAILFHQGYSDRPKSIGCQTMSPTQYADFIRRVGGSGQGFNFTLVDAYR